MPEKRALEVERHDDFHHAARTEIAADTPMLFLSSRIFCIEEKTPTAAKKL